MDADYSIELGREAAALEIPWQDEQGTLQYIDLRATPEAVEQIPEAGESAALRSFLRQANAPESPWQTAKCDAWSEPVEEAENFYQASFARGCYIDLALSEQFAQRRDELEFHRQMAKELAMGLEQNEDLKASAEIVVRRCYFHPRAQSGNASCEWETSDAGYALTLFLTGYGNNGEEANDAREKAIEWAGHCLKRCGPQPEL